MIYGSKERGNIWKFGGGRAWRMTTWEAKKEVKL
jgi:hypothetical protein